jgi:hypothetical protein
VEWLPVLDPTYPQASATSDGKVLSKEKSRLYLANQTTTFPMPQLAITILQVPNTRVKIPILLRAAVVNTDGVSQLRILSVVDILPAPLKHKHILAILNINQWQRKLLMILMLN